MKKRVLLSSVLTIALCLCLIAGSTFALFEKKAEVNIVATAGKLDVTATIEDGKVFTQSEGDTVEFGRTGGFENGGSAIVTDDNHIVVSGMTPGDALKFNVDVTNKSNIKTEYRVVWNSVAPADAATTDLASALKVQVFVGSEELGMSDKVSEYYEAAAAADAVNGEVVTTFTVIVTFPNDAGNDNLPPEQQIPDNDTYQGAVANLNFIVEAVQGNHDASSTTTTP